MSHQLSDFTCPFGRVGVVPLTAGAKKAGLDFGAAGSSALLGFSVVIGNSNAAQPPVGVPTLYPGDTVYLTANDVDAAKTHTLPSLADGQVMPQFTMVDASRIQVYLRGSR